MLFESWWLLVTSPGGDLTHHRDLFEELSFFHIYNYDFVDVYSTIDKVVEFLKKS